MNEIDLIRKRLAAPGQPSSDFDLNPGVVLPEGRALRPAAVLVPLLQSAQGLQVVLTKRSSALKHHPGQIAFPGGKVDPGDVNATAAALREADEEIGLPINQVSTLGVLPEHETVTGFRVHPIVGLISGDFDPIPEPGEVAEVFTVPFSFVMNSSNFSVQSRHWRGQQRKYFTVPYGPYYIWGATARMLRGLAERMEPK